MAGDSLMALLKSVVLSDEVEIITSDDDVVLHFVGNHDTLENSTSDGDVSGEGAFVVDVVSVDCLLGSLEAESDFLVESNTAAGLFGNEFFGVEEDANLLLIGSFVL